MPREKLQRFFTTPLPWGEVTRSVGEGASQLVKLNLPWGEVTRSVGEGASQLVKLNLPWGEVTRSVGEGASRLVKLRHAAPANRQMATGRSAGLLEETAEHATASKASGKRASCRRQAANIVGKPEA